MTGVVVGTASILLRLVATALPLQRYRKLRDRRLLVLALPAAALAIEGIVQFSDDLMSLAVSVGVLLLVAVVGRVTETRLRTLRQVEDSETLHRLTLESVSDAVFIADDQGVVTHAWPAVDRFFGLEGGTVQPGHRVHDLLGRLPLDQERLQSEGEARNVEVLSRRPTGEVRRILVNVKSVDIPPGTTLFACRDITDIRAVESALEGALAEVKELKNRFEAEALYLTDELGAGQNVEGIIGSSPRLQQMLAALETVADTESTVLIRGETGSGKELVARALHQLSRRRDRPLIKVNCAALPPTLVESELFGHEKGAFTGAVGRKVGRFELADGGTLFLDEVGELPLALQPKLLRVLQEGEFERVGGTGSTRVDVRLLAATNRDLKAEVDAGRFRSDLYFRLEVFPILVPALRERREDLLLLASHFLSDASSTLGREFEGLTAGSLSAMESYSWPGNIRELKNVVERAAILTPAGRRVDLVPLLRDARAELAERPSRNGSLRLVDVERGHIQSVLDECGWVIEGHGRAADILGLNPSTLRSRMKRLGLQRPTG